MKVLKYIIPENSKVALPVYPPFEVLSTGLQNNKVVIWAISDLNEPQIAKRFYQLDTGQEIPENAGVYFGTVIDSNGYVTHVFENLE